ncbi:AmmeMemoRadiSam system radical SAM enzyme [bacterium]|nr:MAG: AmmeMemoRadiSam system radical SAM enzyme [bacterium]
MDPCVREAGFWEPSEGGDVQCFLCSHRCRIKPGKRGICRVRENREGKLYTLVYGRVAATGLDPVEKKPLYHFLPGSLTFSLATVGCNLDCSHCQNYSLSQAPGPPAKMPGSYVDPRGIVSEAMASGASSISYTYSEPTIFMEYALDIMEMAHEEGLKNIFVTNGFMTPEAVKALDGLLDAANVDLKGMTEDFYRKVCHAKLEPVLESIRNLKKIGVWVEVTTLVIPGYNDSEEELDKIAGFIKSVDPEMPWHVTGFHPTYKMMDVEPTKSDILEKTRTKALLSGLSYVYTGNRQSAQGANTFCPGCKALLISRQGFCINDFHIDRPNKCPSCGREIAGVFWR